MRDGSEYDDIVDFPTTSTRKHTDPIAPSQGRTKGSSRMQSYPQGKGSQLIAKIIQACVIGVASLAVFYALFVFTYAYIPLIPGLIGALGFSASLEGSIYVWWHTANNSPTEYGHWGATAMALFLIILCVCVFIIVILHFLGQLRPDNTLIFATQIMVAVYVIVAVPALWACSTYRT